MTSRSFAVVNIGELVTLAPLAAEERLSGIKDEHLGLLQDGWLVCEDGKISCCGTGPMPKEYDHLQKLDARGGLVLPGLVDAHTHPVYGGERSSEFWRRLNGETYQDIASSGGGIKFTVKQTRAATTEDLAARFHHKLDRFLSFGVTTIEAKSGYGLSAEEELRLLKVLRSAKHPMTIKTTCLALHAVPPEAQDKANFIKTMTEELLPKVAEQKLADYVDAFVETGYFSVADCEPFVETARSLGLGVRVHADEFSDAGAALAAAKWGAASADHLEQASDMGIAAMAEQKTVAILLPGTSLYTAIDYANADSFRKQNCPIALATDYNPGSCQIDNLPFVATLGALHCKLRPAETIAAVTYVAAFSLGLQKSKGALASGFDADFSINKNLPSLAAWLADMGRKPPTSVFCRGVQKL